MILIVWLEIIQLIIGFEWLKSSYEKLFEPEFIANYPKTMEVFATKTQYHWYGNFLSGFVLDHSNLFGNLIRIGEFATGLGLVIAAILIMSNKALPLLATWVLVIVCFAGAFMNLNFYLASSWSGPAAAGINCTMGLIQVALGIFYITNRHNLKSNI